MKENFLKNWIIDTISEEGYSFKELYEYIINNNAKDTDFIDEIKLCVKEDLVDIYVSPPNSSDKIFLDLSNKISSLENYIDIVKLESKIGSRHYFDLTEKGLEYLKNVQKAPTAI